MGNAHGYGITTKPCRVKKFTATAAHVHSNDSRYRKHMITYFFVLACDCLTMATAPLPLGSPGDMLIGAALTKKLNMVVRFRSRIGGSTASAKESSTRNRLPKGRQDPEGWVNYL
ncbi:hypothetical protein J3459_015877 [Metarhizium acridum]|nr:hypothetical protein J3459_015877 [Metarhizium acridum]